MFGAAWPARFRIVDNVMPDPTPTPKVFISYSWTNDDHVNWVVRLAERLVGDGVDVVLDKWEFLEGHDKFAFMERMVTDATVNKVLAVCDERYAAKADDREGGVGTESQIISKDIYDKVMQEKFIPLVRERHGEGKEFRTGLLPQPEVYRLLEG